MNIDLLLTNWPLLAGMILAGAAGGLLSGLLGVGGGIIVVPVLFSVFSFLDVSPEIIMHLTVGTSFAAMIPTSVFSSYGHYRKGAIDFGVLKLWAPAAFLGCILGVLIAGRSKSEVLIYIFVTGALVVAAYMFFSGSRPVEKNRMPGRLGAGGLAGLIGTVSALMGIGGGTFFVPLFTALGTKVHRAVGTSAALGIVVSIPGFIGYVVAGWQIEALPQLSFGFVNVLGAAILMPVSAICAPLGAAIAHRLSPRLLKICFALFLLATAARMLATTL
ncbi:MAG: sulfite exporter TauE/SafE family protein [Nisaea sp.]|uniref:sulfite exporter TauE/SafE family protein n=1 Tax=Nisaea sp. TaxID=2024842 RepID=UPI001B2EE579|nr:sulfite exporter TauE/SafE family protein [Nisaea sp.]MBO6559272.1 sulfite exporter TauE/SafE family protein [Nisaea sp.]